MRLSRIAPPTPPVETHELRAHLNVSHDDDDAILARMIDAAADHVERLCGQALGQQTWDATLDAFPAGAICLGWGPVESIISIVATDTDDAAVTLDAADYYLETAAHPTRIHPESDWPATTLRRGGLVVRFVAGRGWPEGVRHAVLMLAAHWYENRAAAGQRVEEAPLAFQALIRPHVRMHA